ncbi:hypothetical protein [Enterococcus sp. AZ163]|uniref:hypothetical protein n=1 Tax=Enterococcus sp. AZ163 TaxID=2774638 RepID=UPI003D2D0FBC
MLNILSEDFMKKLRESIIAIVRDAFQMFMKENAEKSRYLQQKDARLYIGGITGDDFNQLVKEGLPEIRLGASGKHKRYDKRAIDEYMAAHSQNE